jgi:hypothetical protein
MLPRVKKANRRMRIMKNPLGSLAVLALALALPPIAAHGQCCGDCNADSSVTVDEVLTAVNFALAGCSAEGPPAVIVRPLEEISADGPPAVTVITDTHATVLFESAVPLVCSVTYGKTLAYGMLSTDLDMNGTGHTDHQPLLFDLEADTEYQLRVQGTAADGTIYVGDNLSFRSAAAREPAGTNLASLDAGAQVVGVSSNFGGTGNNGTWGADKALDGSAATAWASFGDGNDAFIEIRLAEPARLSSVHVWTRIMVDGSSQIFSFILTVDGDQVLGPFNLPDALQAYAFDVDVTATSLRLDVVDSSGGNTGLVEFAAFGTPVSSL